MPKNILRFMTPWSRARSEKLHIPALSQAGLDPALEIALTPPGAPHLDALKGASGARRPAVAISRTVPMILNQRDQWDHEGVDRSALLPARGQAGLGQYRHRKSTPVAESDAGTRSNYTDLVVQTSGFPSAVSVTHGTAHLALYDQAMWDKITRLTQTARARSSGLQYAAQSSSRRRRLKPIRQTTRTRRAPSPARIIPYLR